MTTTAAVPLDDLFAEWDRADSPGCAVAIFQAGEIASARGFGSADLERSVPITPGSVFDIGSTSKQFTAACVLLLAREGALTLDDDVRRHLPSLPDLGGPVTIRHLVHHLSGWRDYLNLTVLAGRSLDNDYPEAEVMALLRRQRSLDFPPGSRHSYSNTGYFLLGEIVRALTGHTLREFAAERIFGPLGMERTFFHDDYTEVVPDRALAYAPAERGFRLDVSAWDVVGDGAVFTTVEDLRHWDRQFYDCTLPGGADLIADLTTPGVLSSGERLDYAFGLTVGSYRGLRSISHGGSWGGYRAEMIRFPDARTTVVVLANLATIDAGGLARQVADRILAERLGPPAPGESPEEGSGPAAELVGTYLDDERTTLVQVAPAGDGTVARLAGQSFPLSSLAPGRAKLAGLPVELRLDGEVLTLAIRGDESSILRRVAEAEPEGPALAGRYHSEELDATYEISVAETGLELRRGWQPPEPLLAAVPDVLGSAHGVLAFERSGGAVRGFHMGTSRARGLWFGRVAP